MHSDWIHSWCADYNVSSVYLGMHLWYGSFIYLSCSQLTWWSAIMSRIQQPIYMVLCKSFKPSILSRFASWTRFCCDLWNSLEQPRLSEGLFKFFYEHWLRFHSFSVQSLYLPIFKGILLLFVKLLNIDLWIIQA